MSTEWVKQAEEKLTAHWKRLHENNGRVQDSWFRRRDELQQKLRQALGGAHFYEISESLGEQYDALGDAMKDAIVVLLKSHNDLIHWREEFRMWVEDAPTP